MTRFIISSFCFLCTLTIIQAAPGHGDYLTIVIDLPDESVEQLIYYPEGSTFEVLDAENQMRVVNEGKEGSYSFEGNFDLLVYPSYDPYQPDKINTAGKRLRVFTTAAAAKTAGFGDDSAEDASQDQEIKPRDKPEITDAKGRYIGLIQSRKELTNSETRPGKYNLKLIFDNGITFSYQDGKVEASLDGEDLTVENRYVIQSKLGEARVSFNPDDGVVWYVFAPVKEE